MALRRTSWWNRCPNGRTLISSTSQYPQRCVFIPVSSCGKQNWVLSTSYVCFHREENQELIKLKVDGLNEIEWLSKCYSKLVENCESHSHMVTDTDTCLFRFFNFTNWLFSNYKERVIYNFFLKSMRMTLKKLLYKLAASDKCAWHSHVATCLLQSHLLNFFWIQKGTSMNISCLPTGKFYF